MFGPFERRRRVFTPSAGASGRALAVIAANEGRQVIVDNPSLLNDALIAASCREQGITLTHADRDFDRIAPFMSGLSYARHWPGGPGVT